MEVFMPDRSEASIKYPDEWDFARNLNDEAIGFEFDSRFLHESCGRAFGQPAMAWAVVANPGGELWHVAIGIGSQQEVFLSSREHSIPRGKIPRWLQSRGYELYDTRWWRFVFEQGDSLEVTDSGYDRLPGEVYFLRDVQRARIKIGYSINAYKRMKSLRLMSSTPLEFMGSIGSPRWFEQGVHRLFASQRAHGEWFSESDDLLEFISESADD
jgi:T5orf172 domain